MGLASICVRSWVQSRVVANGNSALLTTVVGPIKGAATETVPADKDLVRALDKVEKDSLFPQSLTAKHGCNLHAAHLETPTEECPHTLPTHTCFCSSFLVLTNPVPETT